MIAPTATAGSTQAPARYTITSDAPGAEVIATGTATILDARREFETVAATCDQEMRREGSTAHIVMTYGDQVPYAREIGADEPWGAAGYRYWRRALLANGITNDVDVEDTGGGIYVPFVKAGGEYRVDVVDDEKDDGTFLAVFCTNQQADAREGDEIRSAYGLTGAEVIDFVRDAIAHAAAHPAQPADPLDAAAAALHAAGVTVRASYLHLAIEGTSGLIVVTEDDAWVAARYAVAQDFDEGRDPAERIDSDDLAAVVAWIAERAA
ncbi:hypothetical protein [Cellulomonas sp. Y8]|uniref:hypothetical protein n=1 Tax=Cellulomonas sp. Y8 TaxID=2591145 RepID=UPI003D74BA1D